MFESVAQGEEGVYAKVARSSGKECEGETRRRGAERYRTMLRLILLSVSSDLLSKLKRRQQSTLKAGVRVRVAKE